MIKRLIIHTENMTLDRCHDYWRIMAGIKEYYRLRPESKAERLTVRFTSNGEMAIYNNPRDIHDLIICTEETSG